ncbi:MAG: glycosyltransferase family 2 protein [Hafnia sp.]
MSNSLCTIVVPVFNEEKNIKNLFYEIQKQDYQHIEVLFIDDGSTDQSVDIIEKIVSDKKSISVRLIKQKNMGAARARKAGIENARGDYIAFVDCDDCLSTNAISSAMEYFIKKNGEINDIVLFNLVHVDSLSEKDMGTPFNLYTEKLQVSGDEAFGSCIDKWGLHGFGIYRKKNLEISYAIYEYLNTANENYLNNDEIIARICYANANRVITSCSGIYYFVNNPYSTVRRVNNNYHRVIFNSVLLFKYINERYKQNDGVAKKALILESSTIWGVARRYYQWNKLNIDKVAWSNSVRFGINDYLKNISANIKIVNIKGVIQIFLAYLIIVWK